MEDNVKEGEDVAAEGERLGGEGLERRVVERVEEPREVRQRVVHAGERAAERRVGDLRLVKDEVHLPVERPSIARRLGRREPTKQQSFACLWLWPPGVGTRSSGSGRTRRISDVGRSATQSPSFQYAT